MDSDLNIEDQVRVRQPFTDTYPDVYVVIEVVNYEDGQISYVLDGIGAFDIKYLEKV